MADCPAHLPDLLAAERALIRLDERLLASPDRQHRWRHDHTRRAALAATTLAGRRADPEAFLLILADPARRDPDAAWTHAAWTLATALQGTVLRLDRPNRDDVPPVLDPRLSDARRRRLLRGLGWEETPDLGNDGEPSVMLRRRPPKGTLSGAAADLVAQTRELLADTHVLFNDRHGEEDGDGDDRQGEEAVTPLPAWTVGWYDEVQRRWAEASGQRAVPLTATQSDAVGAVLCAVEAALQDAPGLLGVARAVRLLLAAPEPLRPRRTSGREDANSAAVRALIAAQDRGESLWSLLAWLGSGGLIARACGLQAGAGPSLAPILARGRTGFRLALEGEPRAWESWLLRTVVELTERETARVAVLDGVQARWEAQVGLESRRGTSRLPAALHWLHRQPAYTTAVMERTLGREAKLSRRGVYLLAAELRDAGVVREAQTHEPHVGAREVEKMWIASALTPERP
jgi:hypothetical protein